MSTFSKANPFIATLKERYLLTKKGSSKETYHIVLNASLPFNVGSSIGVFAQNDPKFVKEYLDALHATGNELITESRSGTQMTLLQFLASKANLSRLTSGFLKLSPHKHYEPIAKEYIASHDPLDFLRENPQLPLQDVCNQFAPLLPRFYSIASSHTVYPNEIHLTVALFKYNHGKEMRYGVASHYLCHLAELNTQIPIYVQPSTHFFPSPPDVPMIMIGPGTGVAPFRAFLQEHKGKNWLFFGERNKAADYFYQHEFENNPNLRLSLAFSRDQAEKIYVQHKMLEEARDLWQWIQNGAYLYICGDADHMAKDVQHALHQIAMQQGNMTEDEAKAYFKKLKKEDKFQLDVY